MKIGKKILSGILALACVAFVGIATANLSKDTASADMPLFSVSKKNSSVTFGTYDAREHDSSLTGATGAVTGAMVELGIGDELKYNKVIDVSQATKEDILARIVITPNQIGVSDFTKLEVVLTDAYDTTNCVVMTASGIGEDWGTAYAQGGASCTSVVGGWEHNANNWQTGSYGYPFRLVFSGKVVQYSYFFGGDISNNNVGFSLDYATKEVHHLDRTNSLNTMVCDLDNTQDFPQAWKGFTTGECFLSVRAKDYVGSTANFVITSVFGEPITTLDEFEVSDPKIAYDFLTYDQEHLPIGVVNKPYKLFAAKGVSPYFNNIDATNKVYFDYSGAKEEIVVTDGCFTPTKSGIYTIETSAVDPFNHEGKDTYTVKVNAKATPIEVSLTESAITTGTAGLLVKLPAAQANGGSGHLALTYEVSVNGESVQVSNNSFRPVKAGAYKVEIKATDYLQNFDTYEYVVNVVAGTKPVFLNGATLPKYFISGYTYELPTLLAYNYTDGSGTELETTISYIDGDGEKRARGNKITPVVQKNGQEVTVVYSATLNGEVGTYVAQVPTIVLRGANNRIINENLFYTKDAATITANRADLLFDFIADSQFDYVNSYVANSFYMSFRGVYGKTNFGRVVITLMDSENQDQTLRLSYFNLGATTKFQLNDDEGLFEISKSFSEEQNEFSFRLDTLKNQVVFDGQAKTPATITTYENGEPFNGFKSNFIFVSIRFENVTRASQFRIMSIGSKMLGSSPLDFIGPGLSVVGVYGGDASLGEIVKTPIVLASDVVDGKTEVKLTVYGTDGTTVLRDVDGKLLKDVSASQNYYVKVNAYGDYRFDYSTKDKDGTAGSFAYKVSVVDEIPPVITLEGDMPTTGTVGKAVKIPKATITDNYDENIDVRILISTETGRTFTLTQSSFIPNRAGVYTVKYFCRDSAGNTVMQSYKITVS